MASNITLSAGIRQNLLSLQSTQSLLSATQNRLATGKKVNSALDNPTNFFTSQSLSNRASDLNSLLDSIGQAKKTIEVADKGLTAISNLVNSAKSLAKQARQSPQAVSTYAAINSTASQTAETLGSRTGNVNLNPAAVSLSSTTQTQSFGTTGNGSAITVSNSQAYSFEISFNGGAARTVNYTSDSSATYGEILAGLQADFASEVAAAGFTNVTDITLASNAAGDGLSITSANYDLDFTIAANTGAGLTNNSYNSTSLLDRVVAAGGTAGTTQLLVAADGGANQTITFGTGVGQVSTLADLDTALDALTGGITAGVSGTTLSFSRAAGAGNSITLNANNSAGQTALQTALGISAGDFGVTRSQPELQDLGISTASTLTLSVNGVAQSISTAAGDTVDEIITKLQANTILNDALTFSVTGGGFLKIDAKNADVDFGITQNSVSDALGITSGSNVTANSTSLLDNIIAAGGAAGNTLTVSANGATAQTITFGTGSGQVSTLDEFNTALGALSGVTAEITGTSLNIRVTSATSQTTLTLGGTGVTRVGLTAGTTSGSASVVTNNTTRATYQTDYNAVIAQIDELARDASYNGINLLNGDDLQVVFNENSTSSMTIEGVTFTSTGLGVDPVSGTGFQSDSTLDSVVRALDTALTTLRTQATKFGSNLSTVQTRQEFTKTIITTLKNGADNLVIADTNEEAANLLSLQTRQQLSQTALSLANQADQGVLRLFS